MRPMCLKAAVFMFRATNRQASMTCASNGPVMSAASSWYAALPSRGEDPISVIGDGLDEGVWKPLPRFVRGKQHAGNRWLRYALVVLADKAEFGEQVLIDGIRPRSPEPLPEAWREVSNGGVRHGLLVESDHARLTALLKQAGEEVGGHPPLGAADAVQIAAGAAMHEQAALHGHLDDGDLI